MSDGGHEDITISEINSSDLQRDVILYALHPDRLLFIDNVEFWRDFHSENAEKYDEVTPEQLCEYFLRQVLQQIKQYNLNESQENQLSLLSLHPGYDTTEYGFVKTNKMERIDLRGNCGKTLANKHQHDKSPDDLDFAYNCDLNCQVVITPHGEFQHAQHAARNLPAETSALFSAALCSDAYIPLCQLRTTEDIIKGLREAKLLFERTAQQLDNVKCSIEELVEKLKTVCELKESIAKLIYEQF